VCDYDGRHESLIMLSHSMMVRRSHLLARCYLGTMCMCMTGECPYCGIETLLVFPTKEEGVPEKLVSWKRFAMETIITKKGDTKKTCPCI
jgi:hypothetical protein